MAVIYDRVRRRTYEEPQYGASLLRFLYNTLIGRVLLRLVIQPWFSTILKRWYVRPSTIKTVNKYITDYGIKKSDYQDSDWRTFNDFFGRALTKQAKEKLLESVQGADDVVSVAEGKLRAYQVTSDALLDVKQRQYRLSDIIGDEELAQEFTGGTALVYRLSMHNYHRYWYPDDGRVVFQKDYPGVLHTISSVSVKYPVYSINKRSVTLLETAHFGRILMIEVGAMIAGTITNTKKQTAKRGGEKGRFEIGGSTIIVVYANGIMQVDNDIRLQNEKGREVMVTIGSIIGKAC